MSARTNSAVPQFYLRGWTTEPDGTLFRYVRTPAGTLHEKRSSPKSTGFENGLYTLSADSPLTLPADLTSIESEFFRKVDTEAAHALRKLRTAGIPSLSEDDRTAWAVFLNSLLERSARRLTEIDAKARAIVDQSYERMQEGVEPEEHARFSRFMNERVRAAMARNLVRYHMTERIRNPETLAYLKSIRWRILNMSEGLDLITTDSPIIINTGQSEAPLYTLAISISPRQLFIMHPTDWRDDKETRHTFAHIALVHNLLLLERRCKYVYSRATIEDGELIRLRRAVELFLGTETAQATPS